MQDTTAHVRRLGRRTFLQGTTLLMAAGATQTCRKALGTVSRPLLSAGLVTDLHYADKPAAGSRHYRETPDKLAAVAQHFAQHELNFLVELGDFIDAADSVDAELAWLKRINRDFAAICPHRHYVLGNHCVQTLTKNEFLTTVQQQRSYYSFDAGHCHFVVLDSCFRSDGEPYGRANFEWTDPNIPADQLEWLRADLDASGKPTIVFAHQRLDVSNHYAVKNAVQVREILEQSGIVQAVFQGHSHKNDHTDLNGIHYCTLVAMVEGSGAGNNACSVMTMHDDGTIQVSGFARQSSYQW